MVNEPAAVTSSVKPATCEATASPEVAATSALICASSSAGGPARSLLQATAPAARNIAAAVSMGFLNFIRKSAPEGVLRRNAAAINTKEHANRNAFFLCGTPNRASRGSCGPSAGALLRGGKPRTSTGHAPSDPAGGRILLEGESCRIARCCARFRDGRPRSLLTFVGPPLSKISNRLKSDRRCKNCPARIG